MIKHNASFVYPKLSKQLASKVEFFCCETCRRYFLRRIKEKCLRKSDLIIRKKGCVTCSKTCSQVLLHSYPRKMKGGKDGI